MYDKEILFEDIILDVYGIEELELDKNIWENYDEFCNTFYEEV